MLIPRSTRLTLIRLRTNNPADTSSAIDNAICAVASVVRNRDAPRAAPFWPASSRSAATRVGRVLCRAGKSPKRSPVAIASVPGKQHYRSVDGEVDRRHRFRRQLRGNRVQRPARHQQTKGGAGQRQDDGLEKQLANQPRAAGADRQPTAISPARPAPRTSSRLAIFAQAINSTTPVTPKSSVSGVDASGEPSSGRWSRAQG